MRFNVNQKVCIKATGARVVVVDYTVNRNTGVAYYLVLVGGTAFVWKQEEELEA
jgi:hypothetical protein